MDATALRALQAPLKQKYHDSPCSARVMSRAEVTLDPAQIAAILRVDTSRIAIQPAAAQDLTRAPATCSSKHSPRALASR